MACATGAARLNGNTSAPTTVPAWLVILLAMVFVSLSINPTAKDFLWYRGLRRPAWFSLQSWTPLLWLVIDACLYVAALLAWRASGSWPLVLAFLVQLALIEGYSWFLCSTRRLGGGSLVCLGGWGFGVVLTLVVLNVSAQAALLMLPYLLWCPWEALALWQMQRLNR